MQGGKVIIFAVRVRLQLKVTPYQRDQRLLVH